MYRPVEKEEQVVSHIVYPKISLKNSTKISYTYYFFFVIVVKVCSLLVCFWVRSYQILWIYYDVEKKKKKFYIAIICIYWNKKKCEKITKILYFLPLTHKIANSYNVSLSKIRLYDITFLFKIMSRQYLLIRRMLLVFFSLHLP